MTTNPAAVTAVGGTAEAARTAADPVPDHPAADPARGAASKATSAAGAVSGPAADLTRGTAAPPADTANHPTHGTTAASGEAANGPGAEEAAARVWRALRLVVLERNEGRKEVVEALGMSFFRIKALRRIAARPSRLSELAAELGSDRPYLTLVVDDLVKRGLVERNPHPTDRRCKIVTATPEGLAVAARANAILGTPPPALRALPEQDLAELERIVSALAAAGG